MSAEALPACHCSPLGPLKLYVRRPAPTAVKVEVFARERAVQLEVIDAGSLGREDMLAMNPFGTVPILEIAPGRAFSESLTICQFLDEVVDGRRLFGETLLERAEIAMWERRAELQLFAPSIEYVHHTHPAFGDLLRQHPEWARDEVAKSLSMLEIMADRLDASAFLAGDRLSAADLTAYLGYRGLLAFGAVQPVRSSGFQRWEGNIGERPSMAPLRHLVGQFQVGAPGGI